MDVDLEKTCFFCGHTWPVFLQSLTFQNKLERKVKKEIEKAYGRGYRYFLASGALGFDMIAARAVVDFRDAGHPDAELCLMARDDGRQREYEQLAQKGFPSVFTRADEVDYLHRDEGPAPLHLRLNIMSLYSSLGIFYYNFDIVDHVAGIYSFFRYTATEGTRLVNLWEGFPQDEELHPLDGLGTAEQYEEDLPWPPPKAAGPGIQ